MVLATTVASPRKPEMDEDSHQNYLMFGLVYELIFSLHEIKVCYVYYLR